MNQSRENDPALRKRYGIAEPGKSIRTQPWFVPALILTLVGGSWLMWSALHYSLPEIRQTVISFNVVDDRHIQLRYSVTFKSPGKAHLCQLIARDFDKNIVGEIQDNFPAGVRSKTLVTTIPTRVTAVNADISRCAVK